MRRHPLTAYRNRYGLSLQDFAARVSVTKPHIYRIEMGEMQPSLNLLRKIIKATDGEVTAEQFLAFPLRRRPPQKRGGIGPAVV